MASTFPEPRFLTYSSDFENYRPAVGQTGEAVIFEQTYATEGEPTLYQVSDIDKPDPTPFLLSSPAPSVQTRPDWNWRTNWIAFNGASERSSPLSVWIARNRCEVLAVRDTVRLIYPTWMRDDNHLVCSNSSNKGSLHPTNSIIDTGGTIEFANINGSGITDAHLFGGMPAAKPGETNLIAFAGPSAINSRGQPLAITIRISTAFLSTLLTRGINPSVTRWNVCSACELRQTLSRAPPRLGRPTAAQSTSSKTV
jgi:hypothetical protein